MTTPDMTSENSDPHARVLPPDTGEPRESMTWLLKEFASSVPGVTHVLLLSRDGLRLLDSDMYPDWADKLAAGFSGIASLTANIPGPGNAKVSPQQIIIEREDALFFLQSAGTSRAFEDHPGNTRGEVDTVLAVLARPDADVGTVGYEMGRLVGQFAPYMAIPVRADAIEGDDVR
ncbi:roadblock/LC7 domain-containing protein [Streptomyces sp. NPDC002845]